MRLIVGCDWSEQKYGGQHLEVYSPDFSSVHRPGDRWFCTVCFEPISCACFLPCIYSLIADLFTAQTPRKASRALCHADVWPFKYDKLLWPDNAFKSRRARQRS